MKYNCLNKGKKGKMDSRSYHKLLFTLSHYTERVLEDLLSIKSFKNKVMIDFLEKSCEEITSFETFSVFLEKEIISKKDTKEFKEYIERIIKLYNRIV